MKKNGYYTDGLYLNNVLVSIPQKDNAVYLSKTYTVHEPQDDVERRKFCYSCNVNPSDLLYKNIYSFTGIYPNNSTGKYFFNGKLGSGFYQNIFYANGLTCTGVINFSKFNKLSNLNNTKWDKDIEIAFFKGERFTGYAFGKPWLNGEINKVNLILENKLFKDGDLFSGILSVTSLDMEYGTDTLPHTQIGDYFYQHGVLAHGVILGELYKNGIKNITCKPNQPVGVVVYFYKGKIANGIIGEEKYINGVKAF